MAWVSAGFGAEQALDPAGLPGLVEGWRGLC